jgi:hypothetical protein
MHIPTLLLRDWNSLEVLPPELPKFLFIWFKFTLLLFGMEVPLHDIKVGMWYTTNAKHIIRPTVYAETILIGM